jgi:hypothetical protein
LNTVEPSGAALLRGHHRCFCEDIIVKELAMKDLDRLSPNRVGLFALGFFGLPCALAVGFVSEFRPPASNSVVYDYDERLGTQTPSLSGTTFVSNCSDNGAAVVGAPIDGLDDLSAGAIVARGGPQSTAKLPTEATGGHHVE